MWCDVCEWDDDCQEIKWIVILLYYETVAIISIFCDYSLPVCVCVWAERHAVSGDQGESQLGERET